MKRVTTKITYLNWIGLFIIFIGIRSCAVDQKYAEYKTTALNRFTLSKNDTLYRFYAIKPEKDLKVNNSEYYFWYRSDTILQTMGGYSGKLLDGTFRSFYPEKNLLEEGRFVLGQKTGEWKSWYVNGKLKSVVHWKKGKKEGDFTYYDSAGRKMQWGDYKNDLLDGTIYELTPDGKKEKKSYDKGELHIKKSKEKNADSVDKTDQ